MRMNRVYVRLVISSNSKWETCVLTISTGDQINPKITYTHTHTPATKKKCLSESKQKLIKCELQTHTSIFCLLDCRWKRGKAPHEGRLFDESYSELYEIGFHEISHSNQQNQLNDICLVHCEHEIITIFISDIVIF